jgi:hypothetical protein
MVDMCLNVNCTRCRHWENTSKTYGICKKYDRRAMAWDTCDDWMVKE